MNTEYIFFKDYFTLILSTLFESENEWQKIEQVPIPLPRASRNFPDVKARNEIFLSVLGSRWTEPRFFFEMSKVTPFIVIQPGDYELWPFSH